MNTAQPAKRNIFMSNDNEARNSAIHERKIRTTLRTNKTAGLFTVPSEKNIIPYYLFSTRTIFSMVTGQNKR